MASRLSPASGQNAAAGASGGRYWNHCYDASRPTGLSLSAEWLGGYHVEIPSNAIATI